MQYIDILTQAQALLNELDIHKKFISDIELLEFSKRANIKVVISDEPSGKFFNAPAPDRMVLAVKEHTKSEIKSLEQKIKHLADQLIAPDIIDEHYAFMSAEISRMQSLNASLLESIRQSQIS